MFFQQVIAFGRSHELRWEHFLALSIDHPHEHVIHVRVVALEAGDRLLHEPEAILHQRRFDVFDPDLVVRLNPAVRIRLVGGDGLISSARTSSGARFHCIRNGLVQLCLARNDRQTDGARDGYRLVLDAEHMLLNTGQKLFAPSVDIVLVAALEQHEELHAPEAPDDLLWVERLLQDPRELDQDVLAGKHANVALDGVELVDLDHGHATHAAGRRSLEPLLQRIQQLAPVEKSGRRVGTDDFVQMLRQLAVVTLGRRNHQADTRLAFVFPESQDQLDGQRRAVGEIGVDLEGVVAPTALQAGSQRAFERGVACLLEQIHDGLSDHAGIEAKQLEPRRVRVDDNTFLYLDDRIIRSLQNDLELPSGVVRRLQGRVQRALETEGAQLAKHNGGQPGRVPERHEVAGTDLHRLCDS